MESFFFRLADLSYGEKDKYIRILVTENYIYKITVCVENTRRSNSIF